ncbi:MULTISPECIES: tetratricopeptide repeat-containing sulfotransferase family protein [Rhodobacterales]|uniref:tetratricopeptide repeat-containing sulfotransferase family protein n=1 Tax=Rhodobacterales TaxID=204455 RepID=UPI0011BD5D43|nr:MULTISPECIES: sulfotransferase [Rhodobacterales]MDO6591718.1 sulfotransferase [Yoonia sp. 1_MG-2023]
MKQTNKLPLGRDIQTKSLLSRGLNAQRAGDRLGAEQAYKLVLQRNPKQPDALNLMGLLALEGGNTAAATKSLRNAVKYAPRQPMYLLNLANAQLLDGKPELARSSIQKSIRLQSDIAKPWVVLGRIELALGQQHRALDAFEKALRLDPESIVLAMERADVLVALGRMDEAAKVYRTAIAADVRKVVAMISLGYTTVFTPDDPIPAQMVALLETEDMPPKARRALRYAAGKALVDQNKYDAGFAQFLASKQEDAERFPLDQHLAIFERIKERFSAAFFQSMHGLGHPSSRPVFIVGMPRSGTTLVEQILASHGQMAGAGELPDIRILARELGFGNQNTDKFYRNLASLSETQIRKLAARYLATLKRHSRDAVFVVDKMPHNFELLGFIAILFPNAKIIHCKRDPMDTCVSCFTQLFTDEHGYNQDLATLGRYYRAYDDLMAHWHAVLPGRIYDCNYEKIIEDQATASRTLIDWIGVPWDDACLAFHTTERLVHTPSRWQVRQPIYKTSLRRSQKFADHLQPLRVALGPLAPDDAAS